MKILLSNIGSATRKYALFDRERKRASARFESGGSGFAQVFPGPGAEPIGIPLAVRDLAEGTAAFLEFLLAEGILQRPGGIDRAAVRVVAPGTWFQENRIADEACLERLRQARAFAPLHIGPVLAELESMGRLLPGLPILAVSDSAFHSTLPAARRSYGLPSGDAERWGIRRFGYHGLSAQSILARLAAAGPVPARIILCHLGGGSSVTAVLEGRSVDTSMGYSPLEGLIMGTRVGDIDAGAVLRLSKIPGMGPDELEAYLNERCGLLGMSGISSDVRSLLAREEEGEAGARLALEAFVYRVRKFIGAYRVALGGLDRMIFTGGIGEGSPVIRERILDGLDFLGDFRMAVMETEEMEEMARQVAEFPFAGTDPAG
jgi:acetate kinase